MAMSSGALPRSAQSAAGVVEPRARRQGCGALVRDSWPLLLVFAVQVAWSLRLIGADTAFQGEALYLHAGHLEWAHWLHGAPVPPYSYYFSGAPAIYPPLGAAADSLGGLAAARVLSLLMMLGATALLWGTARRLFGRRPAIFATALFALLGPTLHLGAFATYDAMSVALVALAAWCVVRAGEHGDAAGWMAGAGAALALADAAAYAAVLFDLVILVLAGLVVLAGGGVRLAARRCAILAAVLGALVASGLLIGGTSYLTGAGQAVLARVPATSSPLSVLGQSWAWSGLVFLLAVCGVVASWATRQGAARRWLLAVLATAAVIGPLDQARLHTAANLNKHVGLGAWFAAIAAGYAVDWFISSAGRGRARALTYTACVVMLAFPAAIGATQSLQLSASWPNATSFIDVFGPLARHTPGPLLVEDPAIPEYYLSSPGSQWTRWSSTRDIVLPTGASTGHPVTGQGIAGAGSPAVYARYIARGYFSLVALNFTDTAALDQDIAADLRRNPRYHIVQVIPYGIEVPPIGQGTYVVWKYEAGT